MNNYRKADELEIYETIVAMYPEKFTDEDDGDDQWNAVFEFIENELCDIDVLADMLGRIVMLTNPVQSSMTGLFSHVIGRVDIKSDEVLMISTIRRMIKT